MTSARPADKPQLGSYVLTGLIGRGGMAEVYKARKLGPAGFERVVCVKRVLHHFDGQPQALQMFINEAKISARLSHPNIVQVYEFGEIQGEFFLVMEFVDGRDMLQIVQAHHARGQLPVLCSAYVAREVCRALAHAHEHVDEHGKPHPIVHRDISPQNIMISYDGIVKLCDFGIAKVLVDDGAEQSNTGAFKGKFSYMAPEQLEGQRASPRSDIFALGITLHELLTGKRLFKGRNDYETLQRVKNQRIVAPSSFNSAVPAELDHIVLRALDRDVAGRYAEVTQMARDLSDLCHGSGFSGDNLKQFMAQLFVSRPPSHEEVRPDPQHYVQGRTLTFEPFGASGADAAAAPPARPPRSVTAPIAPPSVTHGGHRRGWVGVALVGMILGGVATVGAMRWLSRGRLASTAPATASTGGRTLRIRLDTIPSGATVSTTAGQRLGQTPLDISLDSTQAKRVLRIEHPSCEPLDYVLNRDDAPAVKLVLDPVHTP